MLRLLLIPIAIFCSAATLNAQQERPFVTCKISGQLANQMNQIASTLAYAWDFDAEPFFPELNKAEWNISYNRDHFFFRLNSSSPPRPVKHVYFEPEEIKGLPISFQPDQYLSGDCFFCWGLFHRYRDRLLEVFAPSSEVVNYLHQKYGWLISYPKTVSVHVRTYNEEYHTRLGAPFLGLEYYRKAMDLFPEDTVFVVFSDRINWCKHHFSKFNKTIVCIDGNDHIQDFFLMSMMKDHIIANSCYSWWAAYMDNKPDRKVIAPINWNRVLRRFCECIAFPDWIFVEADLDAPYPKDMKAYDAFSTSIDTQ